MAEDTELQILKALSSEPLRSDPRNHTIPVLQFIPGNGFEFAVQACWYEQWQWPPFDCATSRFEMARQLLEVCSQRDVIHDCVTDMRLQGLVFMHENFIAHGVRRRSCLTCLLSLIFDGRTYIRGISFGIMLRRTTESVVIACSAFAWRTLILVAQQSFPLKVDCRALVFGPRMTGLPRNNWLPIKCAMFVPWMCVCSVRCSRSS